jgi:16S rRNA (uracil1498-N3)-methyltransferase
MSISKKGPWLGGPDELRMRRFFVDPKTCNQEEVILSEEESRHIFKVLRLPVASEIELLDGRGRVYRAVLAAVGKRAVARIVATVAAEPDRAKELVVYQAMLKGEKMDMVIQKCTELGVTRVVPVHTARCQGGGDAGRNAKRLERWRRIGVAACKQCLRPTLMEIEVVQDINDLAGHCQAERRLLFWEEENDCRLQQLAGWLEAQSVALLFGPEGGLTRDEVALARQSGWQTLSLGERILRAETATLGAVAVVQYLLGNL